MSFVRVRYRIIPERSRLWVEARSSLHPIKVETTGVEGFLEVETDPDGQQKTLRPTTGRVEIDTERLKTGNPLYDRELERRLETRKYSRIRGEVREITGDSPYRVRGDLSLHGVTRSVDGQVALRVLDDRTVEVEGERVFDMRDFGLDPPRILMLRVYPEVKVRGRVVAEREA